MSNRVVTGSTFGQALCAHLGLDPKMVESDFYMRTGRDDLFGVTLDVHLGADDMAGIADQMKRLGRPQNKDESKVMPAADAPARSLGELKIVVDTKEAIAKIKAVLRDEYGAELIKPGELLALEPDPRLDEIIALLKRLVVLRITAADMEMITHRRFDGIECRASAPGLHGGMAAK